MARGFAFRLEVVRKVREQKQNVQRRVVAQAARAVSAVEDRIARTDEALRGEVGALRREQSEARLDMGSLCGHRYYMSRLHREMQESLTVLAQKQEALRSERDKLAEASKRLKVIEKLKEKQWKRYMDRINRAERFIQDETGLQQYMRGRERLNKARM